MPRFDNTNQPSEPAEPQMAFSQKPKMPLKPVLLAILGLLLISPVAYAGFLSIRTGIPLGRFLEIVPQICGGFTGKLCPIGSRCATKGGADALGICTLDVVLYRIGGN